MFVRNSYQVSKQVSLPFKVDRLFQRNIIRSLTSGVMSKLSYEEIRKITKDAYIAAVRSVQPSSLIRKSVSLNESVLKVEGHDFILKKPCHVVGFGKAVLTMALELEKILGDQMKSAIISVPVGMGHISNNKVVVCEGADKNIPDESAAKTASLIFKLASDLDEDDTLIVLISGGGSALLPLPLPPVSLEEKLQVIQLLSKSGADITALNTVRKNLSLVKGGKLAVAASPATTISLILSDVIGDPLDIIASGPTVYNKDPPSTAWEVLRSFDLQNRVPESVKKCLTSPAPLPPDNLLNCFNFIIGNNNVAVNAAADFMKLERFATVKLSYTMGGLVTDVAELYSDLALNLCKMLSGRMSEEDLLKYLLTCERQWSIFPNFKKKLLESLEIASLLRGICVVAGGEPTVKVNGQGIGGRNQELALRFAEQMFLKKEKSPFLSDFNVALLSAGTDGIDGPTEAAGAIGHCNQINSNLNYKSFIVNNDSNTFYRAYESGNDLIKIGHTGTNVMDLHILVIQKLHGTITTL